jgi:hypothetical protein
MNTTSPGGDHDLREALAPAVIVLQAHGVARAWYLTSSGADEAVFFVPVADYVRLDPEAIRDEIMRVLPHRKVWVVRMESRAESLTALLFGMAPRRRWSWSDRADLASTAGVCVVVAALLWSSFVVVLGGEFSWWIILVVFVGAFWGGLVATAVGALVFLAMAAVPTMSPPVVAGLVGVLAAAGALTFATLMMHQRLDAWVALGALGVGLASALVVALRVRALVRPRPAHDAAAAA